MLNSSADTARYLSQASSLKDYSAIGDKQPSRNRAARLVNCRVVSRRPSAAGKQRRHRR